MMHGVTTSTGTDHVLAAEVGPLAGVGRRCAQFALDLALVVVPDVLIGVLATAFLLPTSSVGAVLAFTTGLLVALFVLGIAGLLVVHVWWPHTHGGRTPAMGWVGMRVVTDAGDQPPLSAFVLRWLLVVVDGFLWGLVGAVVMLNSARHQRVGDLVANTLVVRDTR